MRTTAQIQFLLFAFDANIPFLSSFSHSLLLLSTKGREKKFNNEYLYWYLCVAYIIGRYLFE